MGRHGFSSVQAFKAASYGPDGHQSCTIRGFTYLPLGFSAPYHCLHAAYRRRFSRVHRPLVVRMPRGDNNGGGTLVRVDDLGSLCVARIRRVGRRFVAPPQQ
jgi:hypothetical protein